MKLITPKRLYCITCDVLLLPDFNLYCPVCGDRLTNCWWALLHGKYKVIKLCDTCDNRYWCWTNMRDDDKRVPTFTQARIAVKNNCKGFNEIYDFIHKGM